MKKEIVDQAAHLIAALLIFLVFFYGGIVGALFAGFSVGYVRELTEEGDRVTLAAARLALGSWKDLSFWTLGSLLAKLLTLVF